MEYTQTRTGPGIVSFVGIPVGTYTYEVSAAGYFTKTGTVSVAEGVTTSITVTLTQPTLTITATVGGTTNPAPSTLSYPLGSIATVQAIADVGYYFSHWELDGVYFNADNPTLVTMDANHTLNAVFATAPPEYRSLTISATAGGTTDPAPGPHSHLLNSTASVTAIPDVGYRLDYWELDGVNVGAPNPISVLMDADHTLTAVFVLIPVPPPCFIATACGVDAPELMVLRRFRDKYLPSLVVEAYYWLSPPLAKCLRGHPTIKGKTKRLIEWMTRRLKRSV